MNESRRAAYLRGDLSHHDYYGLLVELFGEESLRRLLPGDRSPDEWAHLLAEDRHLNVVPLGEWDRMHGAVLRIPVDRDALIAIAGTGGWSLSDTVCVLKTTARRYAEQGAVR